MTDYYLDSVSGSNTSPFDTWSKAATSWSSLVASVTPGINDRVIIGNNHLEGHTTEQTITTGGAMLISSTVSGEGTITYTPAVSGKQFNWSSGNNDFTIDGGSDGCSVWGISIQSGKNLNLKNCIIHDSVLEQGKDNPASSHLGAFGNGTYFILYNTSVTCKSTSSTSSVITLGQREFAAIHGGSVSTDRTTDTTNHCALSLSDSFALLDGVDFSGFARDNFIDPSGGIGLLTCKNCLLNSNTTDRYNSVSISGVRSETRILPFIFDNSNPGTGSNVVVDRYIEDAYGKVETDTSIYLDASDGSTSFSDKVTTSSSCFEFFRFFRYELSSGFQDFSTNKTLTINFAQDGTATNLKDSEIWMEVQYPTSGNSSYSYVDDKASDNQTTANQTTNSEAWTGLGGTNTKQQLSVTTSSGKEGPYRVFVYVSKPSSTLYIDPKVNIE